MTHEGIRNRTGLKAQTLTKQTYVVEGSLESLEKRLIYLSEQY